MRRVVTLLFCFLFTTVGLSGCASGPCAREKLPNQGRTQNSEELYRFVQYAAKHECWSELYDHLSARTREEHSYIKIRPWIGSLEAEEPWEYKIVDVLAKGTFVEVFPGGPQGQELIMVSYQEPGRPELLAQILSVEDTTEDGRKVRRLGLQEQYDQKLPISQLPGEEAGD
ncbi:MAG TPA: hypothetical protein DEA08_27270 [Planctomycetes bacterium]|nr:hypothetical protein [Planctomycetota bacterium]|tara:strand:- start:25 stop:537 length:513 start_codon:yes stop_codon:yes gene_type:complete